VAQPNNEYVLGTHDAELLRLGLQHRLWSRETFDLWERAGIGPGARVLDVGCGPGYGTFDLAQLVTPTGRVFAVDESERFVRYLAAQAEVRGASNVEVSVQDVQKLEVPAGSVDFAYARWVLCFTPRPADVVAGVARALSVGGRFLIQDYSHWQALFLSPASDVFCDVMRATEQAWRDSGGDSAIGQRLPAMLAENGLQVESIRPLQRIARPHEPLWQWPTSFFSNWVPRLAELKLLQPEMVVAFQEDWERHTRDERAFFWTPSMVEIIARRV
jgi:SAM-dependent methyltransferase